MACEFDDFEEREGFQLFHIYRINTTRSACIDHDATWNPGWYLGRLERLFESSKFILPRSVKLLSDVSITGMSIKADGVLGKLYIFSSKGDPFILVVLETNIKCSVADIIKLMNDLYYGEFHINGTPFLDFLSQVCKEIGVSICLEEGDLIKNYHQIVVLDTSVVRTNINDDLIQKLIYRANLEARKEFSLILYPEELNRRHETVAAVGPFVTVLGGQQEYVKYSILISSLVLVMIKQRIKIIRGKVYRLIDQLEGSPDKDISNRIFIGSIKKLMQLRYRMVSDIDSYRLIGLHIPSMRVESYHDALWNQLRLDDVIESTNSLLDRAKEYIELDFMRESESRAKKEEIGRFAWSISVALLSVIAIPPSIIFGFFGSDVVEVGNKPSLFDIDRNMWLYMFVIGSVISSLLTGLIYYIVAIKDRRS